MSLAFGDRDAEFLLAEDVDLGGFGRVAFDVDPGLHLFFKITAQWHFGLHFVGLLVIVNRVEEAIGHAAVVGEDDETFGIKVESTEGEELELLEIIGKHAHYILLADKGVAFIRFSRDSFAVGIHSTGLVEGDVGIDGHLAGATDLDSVGLLDDVAELGGASIEEDETLFDHLIGSAAGAVALERQIAVDAHRETRLRRRLGRGEDRSLSKTRL